MKGVVGPFEQPHTFETNTATYDECLEMKTKWFVQKRLKKNTLAIAIALTFCLLTSRSGAQIRVIDFDNIPPYPAIVDTFGHMFAGLALSSGNQWLADEVYNSYFQYIHNR